MSDDFQNWRDALAGNEVALHADIPHPGYYKMRKGKDGPWQPVAIWRKDGHLVCRVAGDMVDPLSVWTWCAKNPIAKDAAKQAFDTGSFPGEIAIGHNSGDVSLAEEIAEAREQAMGWLGKTPIADKVTADMAANYRARLLDLSKKADSEREGKIRPHLDAQKTINAEYKPLVDGAKADADKIRGALSAYLAAEEAKARAEAERKAREENERRMAEWKRQQEEAAAARAEAEKARQAAQEAEIPPPPPEPMPEPPSPVFVAPEPVKLQAGGQRGKKASLRTLTRYELTDYAAALAHCKDHADVRAAVEKVAFAQVRAGAAVPGVRSYEEKVAV
jgi:hypothetical protein